MSELKLKPKDCSYNQTNCKITNKEVIFVYYLAKNLQVWSGDIISRQIDRTIPCIQNLLLVFIIQTWSSIEYYEYFSWILLANREAFYKPGLVRLSFGMRTALQTLACQLSFFIYTFFYLDLRLLHVPTSWYFMQMIRHWY